MKEVYIAPEAEITTFVPMERLANSFWMTWGGASTNGLGGDTISAPGDIDVPLDP